MRNKVRHFAEAIKNPHIELSSNDFRRIPFDGLSEHSLIYADPPYLITCATYNENNDRGIKFALSNVLKNGDKENTILTEWLERNPMYIRHDLNYNYSNSSYHKKDRSKHSTEVLITNFE